METVNLTFREVTTYFIIANIVLGVLFGLFPLMAGLRLNNRKYGVIGFIGSIVGGGLLGLLLSFPISAVFTWLILRGPAGRPVTQDNVSAGQ